MTYFDKRYDEYRRKCAEIDGWTVKEIWSTALPVKCFRSEVPSYLDDASIDAVVRKLDYNQLILYSFSLEDITGNQGLWLLRATPEQKAEALCRTLIGEGK